MIQTLTSQGVEIPWGFVTTVEAYWAFIDHNGFRSEITNLLNQCDTDDVESLSRCGLQIRMLMKNGSFPGELASEIIENYRALSKKYDQETTDVAVRSSATAEDLPDASFAGQQETYLNVRGDQDVLDSIRNCFASLYTDRAISYRARLGFDPFSIGLSVGIQKMVRSDLACAGVAFSLDTESGFKNVILISGAYGLG
ncbi:MAG: phosphoenolpyruvate synthase, partial [Nanoarchaeota archaeon]|nr:phosphoenolpyruvate synthase [Nanoarchaeota archaeon]